MEFDVPEELYYTESHEWVEQRNGSVRIGITDFAQDELGDIVFVELPSTGDTLERDEIFSVIESIKAVSDIYSPVAGDVVAINDDLRDTPEMINEDPFDDGWMIEVDTDSTLDTDRFFTVEEYQNQIE